MIRNGIHPTAVIDVLGEVAIPESTVLEPNAVIYVGANGRLTLGERNILYPLASIRIDQGEMRTGSDVSFGPGVMVYEPRAGLEIGNHCMIGGGTAICGVNHGAERVDIAMRYQPFAARKIVIEDDVWLGMRVIVMPGITIGRGAIVGAGSVITRDIPPFAVAWGTPCTVHRMREPSASQA
jgi:acetyltransferase-like isoleucine patch superfamily enzyme